MTNEDKQALFAKYTILYGQPNWVHLSFFAYEKVIKEYGDHGEFLIFDKVNKIIRKLLSCLSTKKLFRRFNRSLVNISRKELIKRIAKSALSPGIGILSKHKKINALKISRKLSRYHLKKRALWLKEVEK